MPRPDLETPIEAVVNTLRAADGWCTQHKASLKALLDKPRRSGHAAQADALEAAYAQLQQERRDAIDLTARRDALLAAVRRFLTSVLATIRLQHTGTVKTLHNVLRRFAASAPSRVRFLPEGQRAINRVIAALDAQKQALGRAAASVEAKAAAFKTQIESLQADYAREGKESDQADSAFQALRTEAVKRLANLQLAAEAALLDDDAPLAALDVLFNTYNPTPRASSTSDDLLGSDSDLADLDEDPDPSDSPAGTPPADAGTPPTL